MAEEQKCKMSKKNKGGAFIPAGLFVGLGAGFAAFAISLFFER